MPTVKIGLIGAGTVGSGVYRIIKVNNKLIEKRTGIKIELKKIADIEPARKRPVKIDKKLFTTDAYDLINDNDIDIIIELVGGTKIAKKFIIDSLKNKKHVVTANKALLAHFGREIFSEAEKNNVSVGFEASVGGSIPIIKSINESFVANNFKSIYGIMNGTCNYILSKMSEEDREFEEALKQAQDEGYAEADPTFDIEGTDAAHKLSILILLLFGLFYDFEKIHVEGITNITRDDIKFADQLGYKIKLLGIAKRHKSGLEAGVYPALVKKGTQIADVSGAFNAIYLIGDALGPSMLYGMGAGMLPTASAVVGDIIQIARSIAADKPYNIVPKFYEKKSKLPLIELKKTTKRYYLRFDVEDRPGVLGKITTILGNNDVSIESVIQSGRKVDGGVVPVVIITHESIEKNLMKALKTINGLPKIKSESKVIRIEDL
ncbi:MAG: homoserine dehydrogenase [Thermodesulfobacteriota bacterium]